MGISSCILSNRRCTDDHLITPHLFLRPRHNIRAQLLTQTLRFQNQYKSLHRVPIAVCGVSVNFFVATLCPLLIHRWIIYTTRNCYSICCAIRFRYPLYQTPSPEQRQMSPLQTSRLRVTISNEHWNWSGSNPTVQISVPRITNTRYTRTTSNASGTRHGRLTMRAALALRGISLLHGGKWRFQSSPRHPYHLC